MAKGKRSKVGWTCDLRRLILVGGESGPALVEGNPDESPLLERTSSEDMPPGDTKLTARGARGNSQVDRLGCKDYAWGTRLDPRRRVRP